MKPSISERADKLAHDLRQLRMDADLAFVRHPELFERGARAMLAHRGDAATAALSVFLAGLAPLERIATVDS